MNKWFLIYRYWFQHGIMHSRPIDGIFAPCADMANAMALDRNELAPSHAVEGIRYAFRADLMITQKQEDYAKQVRAQRDAELLDAMPVDEFRQWMSTPAYEGAANG